MVRVYNGYAILYLVGTGNASFSAFKSTYSGNRRRYGCEFYDAFVPAFITHWRLDTKDRAAAHRSIF
jgi:hypothetical protein